MRLAKPHLDIGLFTNDICAHHEFWGRAVGLRLDHELELADGWVQHRYDAHGSVIKVNHLVRPLPARAASGYVGLSVVGDQAGWSDRHPGGDPVRVVPAGTDGLVGIGVAVSTPDVGAMMGFYCRVLGFEQVDEATAQCGDSLLWVIEGPGGRHADHAGLDGLIGPAFRYLTVQIFDADAECAGIAERGGRVVIEPTSVGTVARYGFVTDPDGNWIEISARTSLTGVAPS